jgi:hypothetical protein
MNSKNSEISEKYIYIKFCKFIYCVGRAGQFFPDYHINFNNHNYTAFNTTRKTITNPTHQNFHSAVLEAGLHGSCRLL